MDQIGKEINRLSLEEAAAGTVVDTLEQSPAMRNARELDVARRQAQERQEEANRAKTDWERAVETHGECVRRRDVEAEKAATAWDAVQAAAEKASLARQPLD